MNKPGITSCADAYEADAITVEDAKQIIFNKIKPLTSAETLPLRESLDRFLAQEIISPANVPPHSNSAMDGYAIAGTDLPDESNNFKCKFDVVGYSFAGKPSDLQLQSGEAIRIMTGGVMPNGTDTVIMQEQVTLLSNDQIEIHGKDFQVGQNVRKPGEDIQKGSKVFKTGRKLTSADLGIIASLGIPEVAVYRRPRVAFFSTGDELRSLGEDLVPGEIYDSNRYTLFALLKQSGAEIIDLGVIRDTKEAISNAMKNASTRADIVITSGGVSVGEADFIKPMLEQSGEIFFKKLAIKPGRPLTFGNLNKTDQQSWFFGLPGNPVAVMVTFKQFVEPAINYLASGKQIKPISLYATCNEIIKKKPGRTEYLRGIFTQKENGEFEVKRTGKQGSGILMSMSLANCFIKLPVECAGVEQHQRVEIIPFCDSL